MQYIHIEGKSIEDIFYLPCIHSITKSDDGICYLLTDGTVAKVGDWLCEDDEHNWHIL